MENCHFRLNSIDDVQSSLHLSASEFSWKSHETKIQLKSIFIDEFGIPFQVEHFEKWPRIFQFANSDKDSDEAAAYLPLVMNRARVDVAYLHFMPISGFSIGRIINQFQFYLFFVLCIKIVRGSV